MGKEVEKNVFDKKENLIENESKKGPINLIDFDFDSTSTKNPFSSTSQIHHSKSDGNKFFM